MRDKIKIEVERATGPTDEVRALVAALDDELAADYPPDQRHGLRLEAIFAPHVRFFLARRDGIAVGCGGVALFPGAAAPFAEVKRMFVRPAARGSGVALALLARIEAETRAAGLDLLRLETGDAQPAPLRLYEKAGFARRGPFGDYLLLDPARITTSVFFEKRLA